MGVAERREREKQARVDLIINSARELFDENGFENVSMADVAKEAEVAKGTVYIYFQSKQEILYSILEPLLLRGSAGLKKIAALEDEAADVALKRIFDFLYDFAIEEPDCHHLLDRYDEQEAKRLLKPEKLVRLKGIMRKNLLTVSAVVERGVKQGIFRDVNPWVFAVIFSNLFYSSLRFEENRIAAGGKDYRKSTIDVGLDLLLNGLKRR